MSDETNVGTKLPEVGTRYLYGGTQVIVREVKKRGRGYQVGVQNIGTGAAGTIRLKSWDKGAERVFATADEVQVAA